MEYATFVTLYDWNLGANYKARPNKDNVGATNTYRVPPAGTVKAETK